MPNPTRYEPFADLDDLFKGFVLQPVRLDGQAPQIKIDVKERDGEYSVRANVPGVRKEDINVDVDGNAVSITAELAREKEQKQGDRVIWSERCHGSMSRRFILMHDIDEKRVQAKYVDGVLELTLPKRAVSGKSEVVVQ